MLESGGTRILFDPFLKRNPSLPSFPLEDCSTVSAIFITHPHMDHFADINVIREHCSAPVYVAECGIRVAERAGYDIRDMYVLHAGNIYHAGDFCVEAYQSRHCVFDGGVIGDALRRIKNKPSFMQGLAIGRLNRQFSIGKEDIFAFSVKAEDKEVFILGSANVEKGVSYPKKMDLLVFPYQGRKNMATYSLPFLEIFQPERVMLDHFDDTFPPISSRLDCAELIRMAGESYPQIGIFEPLENQWYEI